MQTLHIDCLKSWLTPRPADAHKGLFGKIVVVGSDFGMPGAVRIAAEGALSVGAGLVTVITRPAHVTSSIVHRPEMLCYGVETLTDDLETCLTEASMIVIGPGLGQSAWSKHVFEKIIRYPVPLLIDADGLNLLSQQKTVPPSAQWILTPHPGEAARLLKTSTAEIQANRTQAIQRLQKQFGGIVVLKGHETLVATTANTPIQCCTAGNPGMASAGMGDLLSGIIAGLFAQGLSLWQAAQAGVILHATAGDRVAAQKGQRGLLATDLLTTVTSLVNGQSAE